MPNRIIKESICESYGLSECSLFAEDLFKRLITYADDYGRFNSDTMIMRARLYPREYETVSEEDIADGLAELAGVGKLEFYTAQVFNQGGKSGVYGVFPHWGEHQRVRDSKAKFPDPQGANANDWYLRRFIPIDMRVAIIERDGFKCKICGKFLTSCREAKRFVKLGHGLYNIDHIVPVVQGGRATMENLRLACPECNKKRKKQFSFREILEFAESPRVAASCRELPPESNPNPIQSESNPNPKAEPQRKRFAPPSVDEVRAYCMERGNSVDPQTFVDFYAGKDWMVGKTKMVDWKACVRTWESREKKAQSQQAAYKKKSTADDLNDFYNMAARWAEGDE